MQRYEHGNETLYFEDGVTLAEMEQAAMRLEAQRGARDRTFRRREVMGKIREYLANEEAQAIRDEAMLQQAREEAERGHQRFNELRREEQMREAQEAAERAAEAAERERLDSRSYVEILNDRNRAKTPKEDFND